MSKYQLKKYQIFIEVIRPWVLLCIYSFLAIKGCFVCASIFALLTILAAFVQMHDTIHGSLQLSKKNNDLLLSLSGLLLLKSGHSMRITHLRHHSKCLSNDDPEGAPANWTFRKVLFHGPYHIFMLRKASFQIAPQHKKILLFETFLTIIILIGFITLYIKTGSYIGILYWGMAIIMSSAMPIWATYIPHHLAPHNPIRLISLKFVRIWTPVISSFAFHHVHHNHPKVPTALLPFVALQENEIFSEHEH
jgi:fatty acid desaturase